MAWWYQQGCRNAQAVSKRGGSGLFTYFLQKDGNLPLGDFLLSHSLYTYCTTSPSPFMSRAMLCSQTQLFHLLFTLHVWMAEMGRSQAGAFSPGSWCWCSAPTSKWLSKTLGKLSMSLLGLDLLQVGARSIGVGNTLRLAKQVDVEAPLG